MKKHLLAFFVCILCIESKAQNYVPLLDSTSNTWHFVFNIIPVRQQAALQPSCFYGNWAGISSTISTIGDTVINSVTYKKLLQREFANPFNDCLFGYVRENTATGQVYFMDNIFSPEELIYDFSMTVGDSIYLDFLLSAGYFTTGYYHLDSISNAVINSVNRRIFYLNNHNVTPSFTLQWIESIGHPGHIVYTKSGNSPGGLFNFMCSDHIARDFYQQLTCFEHNSQKVYFDSCAQSTAFNNPASFFWQDSCTYWYLGGSIEEKDNSHSFTISPNPLQNQGELIIEATLSSRGEIFIYAMDGRQLYHSKVFEIKRGLNKIPILSSEYRHGTYIVELRMDTNSLYQKLVVLR